VFSNDKNIETIAKLVEELKKYFSLQAEYTLLNVVEKAVKLFTVLIMGITLSVLALLAVIFFSFAFAYFLATQVGTIASFSIVGGIYFIAFLLAIVFRKSLIERPLVRLIASILLN